MSTLTYFLLGSVDQIDAGLAFVEITTFDRGDVRTVMPIELFPCDLQEGDYFYFYNLDGVVEIRCGEPPSDL